MADIGAFAAKNRLSELLRRAAQGEEINITNRGKVIARLVPPNSGFDPGQARAAAARIKQRRKGVRLGGLKIRDLIAEGRQ